MSDNEIKKIISEKLNEDMSLSDIQKMINKEHNLKLTFMDIRILASELDNIDWSKNDKKADVKKEEAVEEAPVELTPVEESIIEISKIVRPGMVANGTVTFLSGAKAEWMIDTSGQLGLDKVVGEVTKEDAVDFQQKLTAMFSQ